MEKQNQIYYYGLGGADKNFRVLNFEFIESGRYSIWAENYVIDKMLDRNPGIVEIYAIDNRRGLKWDFTESIREGRQGGKSPGAECGKRLGIHPKPK